MKTTWPLAAALALALGAPALAAPDPIGFTAADGVNAVAVTQANPLPITAPTGAGATQVQGTSAAAATDDGSSPVKVGGVYSNSPTILSNGQKGNILLSNQGGIVMAAATGTGGTGPTNLTTVNLYASGISSGTGALATGVVQQFNSVAPTFTNGQYGALQMSARGGMGIGILNTNVVQSVAAAQSLGDGDSGGGIISSGNFLLGTSSLWVRARDISTAQTSGVGTAAVGVVAQYNTTSPTLTNGQYSVLQINSNGALRVENAGISSTGSDNFGNTNITWSSNPAAPGNRFLPVVGNYNFNSAGWDREFTCSNSAAVNVTAGNTTQIVALSGSTVVRVCSIALSMSATGTVGVYSGTGTNCGTGAAALIQDMALATGTPLQLSAANGSLIRASAGAALCVKAVTGNVTGFISYAQF